MKIKFIVFLILMALFVVIDAASTARGQKPKPQPISVVVSDSTPDIGQMVTLTVNNTQDPNPKWVLGKRQFRYGRSITLSWSTAGQYAVTVIAKDLRGKIKRSSIQVIVTTQPPIIKSVEIPTQSLSLDPVVFNAQATDPSGLAVNYFWDFGDGQTSSDSNPNHSFRRPGSYTVRLTVTDQTGVSASQERIIVILNRSPIALFSTSTLGWWVQTVITFDGRQSHDLDGRITACRWDMGDGSVFSGPYSDLATVTYHYRRQASYTVTLTVTDDLGSQSSRSETIVIGNRNPTAKITANATTIVAGKTITFDGSSSTDPDNDNLTYAWNLGDNTTDVGTIVDHQYTTAGTFTPTLTVADDWGATATASVTITVTPPPSPPRWPPVEGDVKTSYLDNSQKFNLVGEFMFDSSPYDLALIKKVNNEDEKWFLWATPRVALFNLPSGSIVFDYLYGTNSITVDRDGNAWIVGKTIDGEETLDRITLQNQRTTHVKNLKYVMVLGVDKHQFLYFAMMNGLRVYVYVFDLTTNDFVRVDGRPVSWEMPIPPYGATIANGTDLWVTHLVTGTAWNTVDTKIVQYKRDNGLKLHELTVKRLDLRAIQLGPRNELILTDRKGVDARLVALRPDNGEWLWTWEPPLAPDETFSIDGLAYLDGVIVTNGIVQKQQAGIGTTYSKNKFYIGHF